MGKFTRIAATVLIVCLSFPVQAFAAIVSTREASAPSGLMAERERIISLFSREEVRKSLEEHGFAPQAAIDRIHTLSDEEIQQLAASINQAPAGGDVVGVLFTIFIILLVTDI